MSADMSEDEGGPSSVQDWLVGDVPASPGESDVEMDDKPSTGGTPSHPIQKRRRVTRACDECRRKKIKCDGKQPCTHCSVYSYECTYDKPSNRRRNPAPQYIEALEGRLQRAETLLRKFVPDIDLADPNLDPAIQQEFLNREKARAAQVAKARGSAAGPSTPLQNDARLTSMIDSIGHLELDETEGWDFQGASSGRVFLRTMRGHLRGLLGPTSKTPFLPPRTGLNEGELDVSPGAGHAPIPHDTYTSMLPPMEVARTLCQYSLSCATCLVRVVHVPTFYDNFETIYTKPPSSLTRDERKFVGLLFAVMALGCLYQSLEYSSTEVKAYRQATDEGMKYYKTARRLLQNMTDYRDVTSLQALFFIILFLQATSSLSTCYSYLGIALSSAIRMGLHKHVQHPAIDVLEQEVRSRLFYAIRQTDIYVSTLLGFPLLLSAEDINQVHPSEVDDEYIQSQGIIRPPPGTPSFFEAFNAHTRLMDILVKITRAVYTTASSEPATSQAATSPTTYKVSYAQIKAIETDLQQWLERLPQSWRPSPEGSVEVVRVRHLLRFAYAHVQLVLYRPFLHYVSASSTQGKKVDDVLYACAAAAVSVSRNIVHIGLEIRKQQVLSGHFWFMLYTEFFAVLSLVFYALENPDKPGSAEVLQDAHAGRQMIADLAEKSQAADQVTKLLEGLFAQLPARMEQARQRSASLSQPVAATRKTPSATMQPRIMPQTNAVTATPPASRRSQGSARSRTGNFVSAMFGKSSHRSNANNEQPTQSTYQDPASFSANMQDIMPLDMSSRASSDTNSTSGPRHIGYVSQPNGGFVNPVGKVDSVMFSSDDPFAYPNQPMMELGLKMDGSQITMGSDAANAGFFTTGVMDDIDQLLGQPPPYMMQHNAAAHGMTMAPQQMLNPQAMMGMSPGTVHPHHQQQMASMPPPHTLIGHRRAHALKQHERQIDQMFTDQGLQPDWGSFFGSGRGGFQGL